MIPVGIVPTCYQMLQSNTETFNLKKRKNILQISIFIQETVRLKLVKKYHYFTLNISSIGTSKQLKKGGFTQVNNAKV